MHHPYQHESYAHGGSSNLRQSSHAMRQSSSMMRPQGYPPVNIPPVKPYPADPYLDQFPLSEALRAGTLFRWLYDPYADPYRG